MGNQSSFHREINALAANMYIHSHLITTPLKCRLSLGNKIIDCSMILILRLQ